jgi:hypothetical protein
VIRHEAILLRSGARSPEELIVGVAALFAGDRLTDLEPVSEAEDLATALNVPAAVANEWLSRLGPDDAAAFAASLNTRPPRDIRVNLAKTSPHALQAALAKEGVTTEIRDTVTTLLEVVGRANLTNTKAFKAGLFEVQDRSSQILCAALNVEPGMRVLDLCAGAGGKSLALAALGAEVTATDIRSKALDELEKSFQHLQVAEKFLRYHPSDILIELKPLISLLAPKEYTFHALNETTPTYSIVFEKKFHSLTEFYNFKQKFQHTFQTINKENKLTYNERTNYTSLNFFVTLSSGEGAKTSHTTKRRRRR